MKKKRSTKRKTARVKDDVSGQLPKKIKEMFDFFGIVSTRLESIETNESGTIRYNYKIVSDNGNLIKLMFDKFSRWLTYHAPAHVRRGNEANQKNICCNSGYYLAPRMSDDKFIPHCSKCNIQCELQQNKKDGKVAVCVNAAHTSGIKYKAICPLCGEQI